MAIREINGAFPVGLSISGIFPHPARGRAHPRPRPKARPLGSSPRREPMFGRFQLYWSCRPGRDRENRVSPSARPRLTASIARPSAARRRRPRRRHGGCRQRRRRSRASGTPARLQCSHQAVPSRGVSAPADAGMKPCRSRRPRQRWTEHGTARVGALARLYRSPRKGINGEVSGGPAESARSARWGCSTARRPRAPANVTENQRGARRGEFSRHTGDGDRMGRSCGTFLGTGPGDPDLAHRGRP